MTSRLASMQVQFRQKQQDEKEHKLLQIGTGAKQTGGPATPAASRNGIFPSSSAQNKTSPRPGVGVGLHSSSASSIRSVPVAPKAVATKPTTIIHKINLTGTTSNSNGAVRTPSSINSRSGPPPPRVGLDRSATYSKPTITKVVGTAQNRNQRCDENGNELGVGTSRGRIGLINSKPTSQSSTFRRPTTTASAAAAADITKRLAAGLNLGERTTSSASATGKDRPDPQATVNRRPPPTARPVTSSVSRPQVSSSRPAGSSSTASAPNRQRQPLRAVKKATPPPGTVPCSQCGRHFASDRVEKHETICKKTAAKKRKVFDPTKMRMKGTEAEPYLKVVVASTRSAAKPSSTTAAAAAKSNWRKKHEDFIRTIRLAKEYNAHVAAGGNPADLPPPPPSDYSDYVQCPHCTRKFSEAAASRHIPKCSSIKSNKR